MGEREWSGGARLDARWCVRATALGLLAGMWLSSPLWIGPRTYPRAPVFACSDPTAELVERVLAVLLAASLVVLGIAPRLRSAAALACVALAATWALDQTRLQPWAYLYALVLLRVASASRDAAGASEELFGFVRLLLACTYLWSGLQKLHVLFGSVGMTAIVAPLWPGFAELSDATRSAVGFGVAAGESAIGIAFLFERTRRAAAALAIAMHGLLLLVLALGLSWNAVVWPWNAVMALYAAFVGAPARGAVAAPFARVLWGRDLVHRALLALLGALPALSFVDRWDAYPSLALYSPRIDGARVCFGENVKARLPEELRGLLVTRAPFSYELWLEDWAQSELHTPAYPSERVLRVVARRFLESLGMPAEARVVVHARPGALVGRGEQRAYEPGQL